MDFLIEVFFEVFLEGFLSLSSTFVPNGDISRKAQKIIAAILLLVVLVLLASGVVGVGLLMDSSGKSFVGWILIALNVVYLAVGIVLKITASLKG